MIGTLPGGEGSDALDALVSIRVRQGVEVSRVVEVDFHRLGLLVNIETWVLLLDFFLSGEEKGSANSSLRVINTPTHTQRHRSYTD